MKKQTSSSVTNDIYQRITDFVIEQLNNGNIVWRRGWTNGVLPMNIITRQTYHGWNVFWLNFHAAAYGYPHPYYLTFRQAQAAGGSIRKGEKGTPIVFWSKLTAKQDNNDQPEEETKPRPRMVLRQYTVFNIAQTEGIEFKLPEQPASTVPEIDRCEQVVNDMPHAPGVYWNGDRAYYRCATDTVGMPNRELFHSAEECYATLFHELAHSTGHPSRLNRKELIEHDGFGGANYSREELTAELAAAYLCGVCGIEQKVITNTVAYLQSWLRALKNDKTLLMKAAGHAQKAVNYILNIHAVPEDDTIETTQVVSLA
ncbi:ArdC family protein [Chitinophaga sp. XS-30]|uniref:ArdC family protein n=1 Tax=Chitinophaga sp. XS-30 TaxID=2604421 RepID=UPI0011DE20ED|nr:ArdC-like ssDNA-binding domain-containing protein [Chitinophaga sp. XS-30]QEH39425.1 DUF1738 domain-containing protein [Chitinophaga sp. XS-30]